MQWIPANPSFDFMKFRRPAMIFSAVASIVSIVSLLVFRLSFGIDFTGGVILEVTYPGAANLVEIRSQLENAGYNTAQVQNFGSVDDVLIRLPPVSAASDTTELQNKLLGILRSSEPKVTVQRIESVGPQVGEDLAEQGALAMVFALIMIFAYVMIRFRWKLALGAIIATVHDVLLTVGAFSLFHWQFDLTVLGSVLAVLGYSLNDTIVLYDRVRDNFRLIRRGNAVSIVNASVNQTLSRTLITSGTTLLTVIALFLLGGDALWGFSLTLIIGIVVGTYSSIYVASAAALALQVTPADLVPAKVEKVDELP